MPEFSEYERFLLGLFRTGTTFSFKGKSYKVVFSDKPTCGRGEPKTDVFVRCNLIDGGGQMDLKISYKKENAQFIENKIKSDRAEEIFGADWMSIISTTTKAIRCKFESRKLVYKEAAQHTEAGAITLGWKYELLNVPSGELSDLARLTAEQKMDIYSGVHLPPSKRNAYVCNRIIDDSGVAEYLIVSDGITTAQQAINQMQKISDYALDKKIYFACKALNYRTLAEVPKWDGNRPLSVQVDWTLSNGKLTPTFDFDHPLVRKGNEVGDNLKRVLRIIGAKNTNDLTSENCTCVDPISM